jgi:hypothetical protein
MAEGFTVFARVYSVYGVFPGISWPPLVFPRIHRPPHIEMGPAALVYAVRPLLAITQHTALRIASDRTSLVNLHLSILPRIAISPSRVPSVVVSLRSPRRNPIAAAVCPMYISNAFPAHVSPLRHATRVVSCLHRMSISHRYSRSLAPAAQPPPMP